MIYDYIFDNISYNYLIFVIFIIFLIGYCFNKSNFTSKGVLGIIIGIIIGWILIDFNRSIKKDEIESIKNMKDKSYLFKDLGQYEEALILFYNSYQFGKNNLIDFKKSIGYFIEMMNIYNLIKITEDRNIFLQTSLQNKYQQCINSFKSLELTIEYFQIDKFRKITNSLNNLLLNYVNDCIDLNNKYIETNGFSIYNRKLYKDPKEYNYNIEYNDNMI